jgi:hypothetical protein
MATQPTFYNGYINSDLTATYDSGVETIISSLAAIGADATIDDLNKVFFDWFQKAFNLTATDINLIVQTEAMVGNIFNAYTAYDFPYSKFYNSRQLAVIGDITEGICKLQVNQSSGDNFMQFAQESIVKSGLSAEEQAPLLMALAIASDAYDTIYGEILSPDADWSVFLDSNSAVNLSNLSGWVNAIIKGTLIGATQSFSLYPPTGAQAIGIARNIPTAIAGAVIITAGMVALDWVQYPSIKWGNNNNCFTPSVSFKI